MIANTSLRAFLGHPSASVVRVRSGDVGALLAVAEQKGAASALLPPEATLELASDNRRVLALQPAYIG